MKILELDDIVYKIQPFGGMTTYWQEVSRRLEEMMPGEIIHNPGVKYLRFMSVPSKATVFHSSHFRVSYSKGVKNVVTIHDLIYERGLAGGKAKWLNLYERRKSVARADSIICISQSTKNDLLEFYPEAASKPIHIIYHGVSKLVENSNKQEFLASFKNKYKFELQSTKYFLYVGGRGAYKNFSALIDAFQRGGFKDQGYKIICTGKHFSPEEMQHIQALSLTDSLISLGKVDMKDLGQIYAHALALVYPSLFEGFGLPPLEAMMSECPVICVNTSSLPEVVGDAGILVTEKNTNELVDALHAVLSEKERQRLIAAGLENVKRFTWEKSAQQHFDVYQSLI